MREQFQACRHQKRINKNINNKPALKKKIKTRKLSKKAKLTKYWKMVNRKTSYFQQMDGWD